MNLAVPTTLGMSLSIGMAWAGVAAAVVVLLVGWLTICSRAATWVRPFVTGALLVGLSQVFPLLQLMAGVTSLGITEAVGLIETGDPDAGPPHISNPFGSFLASILCGSGLLAVAVVLGWLLGRIFPALRGRPGHRDEVRFLDPDPIPR